MTKQGGVYAWPWAQAVQSDLAGQLGTCLLHVDARFKHQNSPVSSKLESDMQTRKKRLSITCMR